MDRPGRLVDAEISILIPELLGAHRILDKAVDAAFGAPRMLKNEKDRLEILFSRYAEMTG